MTLAILLGALCPSAEGADALPPATSLAEADALVATGELADAALAYVSLMDAYPDSPDQITFHDRLNNIDGMFTKNVLSPDMMATLYERLPPLSSVKSAAGAFGLVRLYWYKEVSMLKAEGGQQLAIALETSLLETILEALPRFQHEPAVYLLVETCVQFASQLGEDRSGALLVDFDRLLATAEPSMMTFAVNGFMVDYYGSRSLWEDRDRYVAGVVDARVGEIVVAAVESDAILTRQKLSMIRFLTTAQFATGGYAEALANFDLLQELDPEERFIVSLPPAARLGPSHVARTDNREFPKHAMDPTTFVDGAPLLSRADVFDTENPLLYARMRMPGKAMPGEAPPRADQRLIQILSRPVFYADPADDGWLKPITIELEENTGPNNLQVWREHRNTIQMQSDSLGRNSYRLGNYGLHVAALGTLSLDEDNNVLRNQIGLPPNAASKIGPGDVMHRGPLHPLIASRISSRPGGVGDATTIIAKPEYAANATHWMAVYRWESANLKPVLRDRAIHWLAENGDTIMRFAPPRAWDAQGLRLNIFYRLRDHLYGLAIPTDELEAAHYHVVYTSDVVTGERDSAANLSTYGLGPKGQIYSSMYGRFPLPALPGVASIDRATFHAQIINGKGGDLTTTAYCAPQEFWSEHTGHGRVEGLVFPGPIDSHALSALDGWARWDILGDPDTTGIAKAYAAGGTPEPQTIKIDGPENPEELVGNMSGYLLGDTGNGPFRQFFPRTMKAEAEPHIELIVSDPDGTLGNGEGAIAATTARRSTGPDTDIQDSEAASWGPTRLASPFHSPDSPPREAGMVTLLIRTEGLTEGSVSITGESTTYEAAPDGTLSLPLGEKITLLATPSTPEGSFYQWRGGLKGGKNPATIEITRDLEITAGFYLRRTITVATEGDGAIEFQPPQPEEGYAPGTEITINAVPDPDNVFSSWKGLLNDVWAPEKTYVVPTHPGPITAVFAARPGITELRMLEDLGEYLVATGVYTDPAQVLQLDFDTGDRDMNKKYDFEVAPNGIPDGAELLALQHILQTPGTEIERYGVSHIILWEMYIANIARAATDLPDQSAPIQRAVAAYMTLGDWGFQTLMERDGPAHFGTELKSGPYECSGLHWFPAEDDMDLDGITNIAEWNYAASESQRRGTDKRAAAEAYARAVSDPGIARGFSFRDLPPTAKPDEFGNLGGGMVLLTVAESDSENLEAIAALTTQDGQRTLILREGESLSVGVGTEILVTVEGGPYFKEWEIVGTLCHESTEFTERFILTDNTIIRAKPALISTVYLQHDDEFHVTWTGSGDKIIDSGEDWVRVIDRAQILLSATSNRFPHLGLVLTTDEKEHTFHYAQMVINAVVVNKVHAIIESEIPQPDL